MIEPIDKELVSIVAFTANQINRAKGYRITYDECEVETILQSIRLVNSLDKVRNETTARIQEEAQASK